MHLIHIGNSLGVRIPKTIIAQVGCNENMTVQLKVTKEGLLIVPINSGREGWERAFSQEESENSLLMGNEIINQFDNEEWEW